MFGGETTGVVEPSGGNFPGGNIPVTIITITTRKKPKIETILGVGSVHGGNCPEVGKVRMENVRVVILLYWVNNRGFLYMYCNEGRV